MLMPPRRADLWYSNVISARGIWGDISHKLEITSDVEPVVTALTNGRPEFTAVTPQRFIGMVLNARIDKDAKIAVASRWRYLN